MEVETWRPLKARFSFGHLRGFLTENHQVELMPDVGEPVDQEGGEDAPDVTHGGADEHPEVPETQDTEVSFCFSQDRSYLPPLP